MRLKNSDWWFSGLLAAVVGATPSLACGPDFPNNLLSGGDSAVLVAPEGDFARELSRMKIPPGRFDAVNTRRSYAAETGDAEAADLLAALKKQKVPEPERDRIVQAHRAVRRALVRFVEGAAPGETPTTNEPAAGDANAAEAPAKFPQISIPDGLPPEFSDYLEGALAWHNPAVLDKDAARSPWERLLQRPATERHFKSTWAAFMLGRSWEEAAPEKAIQFYRQVRALAQQGFVDSAGLAAASLGREAHVDLDKKRYEEALELYLQQLATGDSSATNSLRFVAAEVLRQDTATLMPLAKNPRTQRVITAYAICQRLSDGGETRENGEQAGPITARTCARNWLAAVEAAEVKDVESAEELALAAYRVNEMELAQRWIQRARGTPVAQWLQAKLWLRAGKLDQAAALLAGLTPSFPIEPPTTNATAPRALKDTLFVDARGCWPDSVPAEQQVLGELGVLRLARREYTQSLDALLNAGFWMDAAYVAERVLTVDELKGYVDAYWPPVSAQQVAEEKDKFKDSEVSPALLRQNIRYLLARRLARLSRGPEARDYYPSDWLPQVDVFLHALKDAWDEALPMGRRAGAFFEAATIMRTNGMELVGTEVEPDWHFHMGDYQEGVTVPGRATNSDARVLVVSSNEWARTVEHKPEPEARFHYRYQAASLAWEAAKLMPDNSDQTAKVLWTAGSWLKYRDPQAADFFYKALVRRNRKTALGAEADRRRWFPELDEDGNVVPRKPRLGAEDASASASAAAEEMKTPNDSEPVPQPEIRESVVDTQGQDPEHSSQAELMYEYVVQSGDTLAGIASACWAAGIKVGPADILNANPGLDPGRLLIGQKIFVPAAAH